MIIYRLNGDDVTPATGTVLVGGRVVRIPEKKRHKHKHMIVVLVNLQCVGSFIAIPHQVL